MPVPFHAAMRDDLRPHQADNERALLEQRARLALADEHRQRRHRRADRKRGSNGGMNVTPLRVACAIGLLLLILGAMASKASAQGPVPGPVTPHATVVSADATGIAVSSASGVQCPCNPDLPRHTAVSARSSLCPCNAGLPDGPAAAIALHGDTGRGDLVSAPANPAPVVQPSETFDWADAGVGAGATMIAALFAAAGALAFSRRRAHGQLTAESNR